MTLGAAAATRLGTGSDTSLLLTDHSMSSFRVQFGRIASTRWESIGSGMIQRNTLPENHLLHSIQG